MMAKSRAQRLRAVEHQLQRGKVPIILSPLPGVEQLLQSYGLEPNKDVVVPAVGESQQELAERRAKLRASRQYQKQRAGVGRYTSRAELRRESANRKLANYLRFIYDDDSE